MPGLPILFQLAIYYTLDCCQENCCISKHGHRINNDKPKVIYDMCKKEILTFGAAHNYKNKHRFVREKLAACYRGVSTNGRQIFEYNIGKQGDEHFCANVCRTAFEKLYGIAHR